MASGTASGTTDSKSNIRVCTRCVLDTTVQDIRFDANGVCNYCHIHDEQEKWYPLGEVGRQRLEALVERIKLDGRGKKYDCIVGVSGGTDSTYTLFMAKKYGLRPLAVHFDNGWNSEIAVSNIKNAIEKLGVDLFTVVADWDEFKDLQRAFLRASVPDAEIPTDYAIYSILFDVASKHGIKYVLQGHSFRAEGTSPVSWTYMDGKYIRSVHEKYGTRKIKSFPLLSLSTLLYYVFVKQIKEVRLLEYIDYQKKDVKEMLAKELGWVDYGGHHHESLFTQFFQSYYIVKKFNIDKRKTELSAFVRSGMMRREDALAELSKAEFQFDEEKIRYVLRKLDISDDEFAKMMRHRPMSFRDYPTYQPLIRLMRGPLKTASRMKLVPEILYLKYGGSDDTSRRQPGRKLNIVVDINHPGHVHFFKNFIWEMEKRGHRVLVTAQEKEMTYKLLDHYKIPYVRLGRHTPSMGMKLINVPYIDLKMLRAIRKFKPDAALGIASYRAAHTAWLSKADSYIFDDTEHAKMAKRLYMPFVTNILTPSCYVGDLGPRHIRYKGYHELAYLHPNRFKPDPTVLGELGVKEGEKYAIVRFVAWTAGHDIGQSGFSLQDKRDVIKEIEKHARPIITSEAEIPEEFRKYQFNIPPHRIHDALYYSAMYVGEGATMASESAMLGVPSVYVNSLNAGTLNEQAKYGLVYNYRNANGVVSKVSELFVNKDLKMEALAHRDRMLVEKTDVTGCMINLVENGSMPGC